MADHERVVVEDRDRVVVEERRRNGGLKLFFVILLVVAIAAIAFFALGGKADVDTDGNLEVPEVDVDVNAPDVNVDSTEAPPASADANQPEG